MLVNENGEMPSVNFAAKIEEYLASEKRCTAISARELADRLYAKLSDDEKDKYFNKPLYAAFCCMEEKIFDDTFIECIEAYQRSLSIRNKINQYLDKVSPDRDRDDYEIDKVISMLPDASKEIDNREYLAYTAICWLEDMQAEEEAQEKLTINDIPIDSEAYRELVSEVMVNVNNNEPYAVAYRSGFEKAIGSISKGAGKMLAYPTHLADVASKSFNLGEKETLGDNLYEKVKNDKELAALVRQHEEEREELEARLEEMQKKLDKKTETRQTYDNSMYGYPYNNNRYPQQQSVQQQQYQQGTDIKWIAIGVNVALLLLCMLFDKLLAVNTFILWVGLGISTYGWAIKPTRQQYTMQGGYKKQNSYIKFVLIGYAWFIIFLFLILAL